MDEYQVEIKYRQGIHNGRADMLSKIRIKPIENEIKESNEIIAINANEVESELLKYDDIVIDQDVNMRILQQHDKHCTDIITQLTNNNENVTDEYIIQDLLLFHTGKENKYETEPFLQLVIPQQLKHIVIKGYHENYGGGYVGLEKTYQKIRSDLNTFGKPVIKM